MPSLFWIWGGFDPQTYRTAEAEGTLAQTIPGNHASTAAPVPMSTGVTASGSVRSRAAPVQSPRVTGFGAGRAAVPR